MNAADTGRALIFAWEKVRRVPVILPGFILLAFVGHAAAFFLFRVVYPPQASLPMPPPPITVLDPSRPDHQALLRWAEGEDTTPAIAHTGVTDRLLEVPYRPFYSVARTAPLTLPEQSVPLQFPPARDPLTFIRSVEPKPQPPSLAGRAAPTAVTFSPELAARQRGQPTLALDVKSADPLDSAEFLVGVTDRGEARFVILQRTSGNAAFDSAASAQLTRAQFAPAETPITWGRATIHWSADAYADRQSAIGNPQSP